MEKINSTRDQLKDFIESVLWDDIKNELLMWREGFQNELNGIIEEASTSSPSTVQFLIHLGDLNGRLKAVDYFLSLPSVLLDILEAQKKEKKLDLESSIKELDNE